MRNSAGFIVFAIFAFFAAAHAEPPAESVERMVVEEALHAGLSPELALAVAKVESGFKAAAVSSVGARGVMQIMPATARGEFGVGSDLLENPRINARLGVYYLKSLVDYYGSEEFALSHYNGGTRVGPPPYSRVIPETRSYVEAVLSWKRRFEGEGAVARILAGLDPVQRVTADLSHPSPAPRAARVVLASHRATPVSHAVPHEDSSGRWVAFAPIAGDGGRW